MKFVPLVGRILFSMIFLSSGLMHLMKHGDMTRYAASQGVPMPGVLVAITGLMIIAGGLSVLTGYKTNIGAWLLVAFLVPTAFMMHNFWAVADPMMSGMQMAQFMKNLALAGGAMAWAYFGTGPLSVTRQGEASKAAA